MGSRIKIPNINFSKVGEAIGKASKDTAKFIGDHKVEFLSGGLILMIVDGIRVRLGRKRDRETFEKRSVKQQKIVRKHEAEINALRTAAEQSHEATMRVNQLEQIVKSITEAGENK